MVISFENLSITIRDHIPLSFDIISAHVMHYEITLGLNSQFSSIKNDSPLKNYVVHMLNIPQMAMS
jgi:hypothetical protein